MNERRKIVIPTGAGDPDEPLTTPHFDAEATMTARPVVPLSEQEAFQRQYGGYGVGAQKPFWKRPALLTLIVLSAIGIGVAAGLAIGISRSRQNAQTPVVNASPSAVENPNSGQKIEEPEPTPAQQARVIVPEKPVETSAEPKDEERAARDERKDSKEEAVPPVVRDKKRDKKNDEDNNGQVLDEKQAERERKQEEKREQRRRQREEDAPVDVPRRIERAGREINRIREIFEGRQP
jgi:hypothetical protein